MIGHLLPNYCWTKMTSCDQKAGQSLGINKNKAYELNKIEKKRELITDGSSVRSHYLIE